MKYALKSGSKTVATAGTAVALTSSSIWARGLRLAAPAGNAGNVFLGGSTVSATTGIILAPGDHISLSDLMGAGDDAAVNLSAVYIDAATNGDKLTFAYLEPAS